MAIAKMAGERTARKERRVRGEHMMPTLHWAFVSLDLHDFKDNCLDPQHTGYMDWLLVHPRAPSYLKTRLLGYVTLGYIEASSIISATGALWVSI